MGKKTVVWNSTSTVSTSVPAHTVTNPVPASFPAVNVAVATPFTVVEVSGVTVPRLVEKVITVPATQGCPKVSVT